MKIRRKDVQSSSKNNCATAITTVPSGRQPIPTHLITTEPTTQRTQTRDAVNPKLPLLHIRQKKNTKKVLYNTPQSDERKIYSFIQMETKKLSTPRNEKKTVPTLGLNPSEFILVPQFPPTLYFPFVPTENSNVRKRRFLLRH